VIDLIGLGKAWGDRTLFSDVNLKLQAGARYGLVGANGSGKTTLLKIIAGDEHQSDGEVSMSPRTKVGVLRQDRFASDTERILDVAMMGDAVWPHLQEQERLLADGGSDAAQAIADVEEKIRAGDGYSLPSRAAAVLEGLGIPGAQHALPLSTLSGGFKLRVLLAQTLVAQPDALLLDEPTNHLDILSIRWLEKFLASYQGCALCISHDHRFLDNIATHILDVDYETVTLYHGDYAQFVVEKEATRVRMDAAIERQQSIIDDKKAFIERFRYKASKARQAQSRAKQIEKLEKELTAPVQSSRRAPNFKFEQRRQSGQDVLTLDGIAKSYGEKRVLTGVSLGVRRGERVAILGANGLGKSTLLRIAVGRLQPDAGTATWGYEAHPGYFAQDQKELFEHPSMTALSFLWDACSGETVSYVRGQLGRMLISGDDVEKRIASLSGGEAARLVFARLMVQKPNVLVLDEPTNHLDLESIEALVAGLRAFEGTLIFVSHDRWFVSQLATRIVELRADGMQDFPGTYDEYVAHCNDDHLDAGAILARAKKEKEKAAAKSEPPPADRPGVRRSASTGGSSPPKDWNELKRRRSEHQKMLSRREKVTEAIDRGEKRLAAIRASYCRAGFFESTPPAEVAALQAEEAKLAPEIEALVAEWEKLEADLAETAD
jgi:ATPase subunit of ABC transporter with duplicated ATPase domains